MRPQPISAWAFSLSRCWQRRYDAIQERPAANRAIRSHAHWHVKKRHILRHNLQDVLFWSASDGGADTVVVVFFGAPRSPPRPTWGRPGDRRVAPLRGHGGRQGLAQEGGQARCCSSVLVFAVPKQEDPPQRGWRRQTFVLVLLAGEEHSNQERVRGGKSIMLLFSLCTINCSRFAPPPVHM